MSYNISSGDIATAFKKTIFGTTWNDSRAYQVCNAKVTAYGTEPLIFSIGTRFVQGSDDNAIQYRVLARRIVLQPGEVYEIEAITVFYNQQVYVRQISGNGIAYIYSTPFLPRADRVVQGVGTTFLNVTAGNSGLYYMQNTQGTYGTFDVFVGNYSGSPVINIAVGSTATTPQPKDFVVRNAPVLDSEPYIFRKAMMKSQQYLIVQVTGGVCDICMLGFGVAM